VVAARAAVAVVAAAAAAATATVAMVPTIIPGSRRQSVQTHAGLLRQTTLPRRGTMVLTVAMVIVIRPTMIVVSTMLSRLGTSNTVL
jgi:hypothetical protein